MAFDNYKNFVWVTFAQGFDATATSAILNPGDTARLPAVPFDLACWNVTDYPTPSLDPDREIFRVTAPPVGNTITIARAQQGTPASPKNIAGKTYVAIAGVDEKFFTDLAAALTTLSTANTNLVAADAALDARLDTAEAAITTLDTRVDSHDTTITSLQAADTALDDRVDGLQATIEGFTGDLYLASDYGITPANADNTTALQTLINTIAALSRNATIVFEEEGPYVFAGALQDTSRSNCIIKFPEVGINDKQYTIMLKGGEGRVTFSPSAYTSIPLPAGTKIKCTTNSSAGSFMSGIGPVGDNANDNTFCCVGFDNIIFLMPVNPVLTCLHLNYFTNTWFRDCSVIAGNSQSVLDTVEPTTATSYGVVQPKVNSGINQRVEGVLNILGFYNGLRVGEGALIADLGVWSCKNGLVYDGSNGASRIIRVISGWCQTVVKINGNHPMLIDEYDSERWTGAGWYQFQRDVDDPANYGHGEIRWRTVIAASGPVPGLFTVNGAANMYLHEIGVAPVASVSLPAFASGDIGAINSSTVVVQFDQAVKAPNYSAGVTIKVNGTPATISSSARQTDKTIVHYVLGAPVIGGDVVLFSYEGADGFIQNENGGQLADITDEIVVNGMGGAPVLYDLFTGTDGTLLTAHTMNTGPGWTKREGAANEVKIQANKAQTTMDNASAYCYIASAGVSDYEIHADIEFAAFGGAGNHYLEIIARETNLTNRIRFIMTESGTELMLHDGVNPLIATNVNIQIVTEIATTTTTQASMTVPLNPAQSYPVKVIANGTALSLEIDTHIVSATHSFNQTATNCGFRVFQPYGGVMAIDNFMVIAL